MLRLFIWWDQAVNNIQIQAELIPDESSYRVSNQDETWASGNNIRRSVMSRDRCDGDG